MKLVDIVLKDGTKLSNCSIYNEGVNGEAPIQNEEELRKKFQVYPWGNECRSIPFQTTMMQGYIPVTNVKSYLIKKVD
ncbi:hypothetical protein ABE137_07110 [Brevibacillus laterosporus]|uniref:hypothetical protein n=1 Tax=Brevibacillus laterosporus TaxID=1465 RepID=UPI003D1A3C0D